MAGQDLQRQWLSDVSQPDYRERVKATLKAKHISKAEFARRCGCSPSNVYAWLNGYSWQRFPKYMWAVARNLGVSYD
jgi:transcriptional regulator with XRE-family HTH domain